jgi:SAM-dependent methyltransferase
VCDGCGCNARQRAVANILLDAIPDHASARVYLTEQASPFYVAMRRHVPGTRGSEFGAGRLRRMRLAAWLARHGRLERIRLEDVRALSFADASLDAVVSQDVLEHVADHRDALREAARVLRPGGVLVLSVPFYDTALRSEQIAWPDGRGGVRFAGEPEFHGDPVGGGVACFHHFGWDLLQDMRDAGFADACACRVHGPGVGLPEAQWVLRAVR